MHQHLDTLQQISDLNIREFADTLAWWAERDGKLHSAIYCDGAGTGTSAYHMTLKQALATNMVCAQCASNRGDWNSEQNGILDVAIWLGHTEHDIQTLDTPPRRELWHPQVINWRNFNASQHLRKNLNEANITGELSRWVSRLLAATDKYVAKPVNRNTLQREVLHISAVAVLRKQAHGGVDVAGTDTCVMWPCFNITDGTPGHSWRRTLANTWIARLAENMLIADVNMQVLQQLADINDSDKPDEQSARQQAETLLQAWTAQYENLVAPAQPVILGMHMGQQTLDVHSRSAAISEVLVSTPNWMLLNGLGAALCHPTIAADIADMPWHMGTSRCQYINSNGSESQNELQQLLTLWDPKNKESVYHKLEDAYTASQAL